MSVDALYDTVIVTTVLAVTFFVAMVNEPKVAPEVTVIVFGTVARELEDEIEMTAPEAPAATGILTFP